MKTILFHFVIFCTLRYLEHVTCGGTKITHIHSHSQLRSTLASKKPQVVTFPRTDDDVTSLYHKRLHEFTYDPRNVNLDNERVISSNEEFCSKDLFAGGYFTDEPFSVIFDDMDSLINSMRVAATESDSLFCRLAIIKGVRCPKWHEDYVDLRLIKSYVGEGTEWIDPNNISVRLLNFARSHLDMDLDVVHSNNIIRGNCGDAIVIPGRNRHLKVPNAVPVLHRSPVTKENSRRLLLTVTINAKKT